jgi:ABC-type nitrate/sulfonate/bicarbonate transport system substrate-binding protein
MVTARWLAVALLALCSLLFSPALAAAQAKVKLVLDWQIQGPQAPFITAKATGAFTSQGLDVTIDRGTGSQKTIELVATGTYDIGYGDVNSMIEYNVKNPQTPLIAVAMVLNSCRSRCCRSSDTESASRRTSRARASGRRPATRRGGSGPSSPSTSASPWTA